MSSDIATEANVVLLDPELAQVFPDSKSVNDVLRAILAAAMRTGTRGADDLRPKAVVWGAAGRRRSCSANRKHRIVVAGIEAFQLITASDINRISTRRLRKEITQLILIFRTQLRANEVVDIVGIGLIEPCRCDDIERVIVLRIIKCDVPNAMARTFLNDPFVWYLIILAQLPQINNEIGAMSESRMCKRLVHSFESCV